MEVYKVVTTERTSLLPEFLKWSLRSEGHEMIHKLLLKRGLIKDYPVGALRKAHPESVGLLCFDTFTNARIWKGDTSIRSGLMIISVKGFGEPKKVKEVIGVNGYDWLEKSVGDIIKIPTPPGTIAFSRLRVLT